MRTKEYLQLLKNDIHSTAFATIGADGHPQVRIIDIMLVDDAKAYFLTARGKDFYRQLVEQQYVAVAGTTQDKRAISLRGKVQKANPSLLDAAFAENPYMAEIYPGETRFALEMFEIYEAVGEFFDLSQKPVFRDTFVLGSAQAKKYGYFITDKCIGCRVCLPACPQKCISIGKPMAIDQSHCLHCGRCAEVCPADAVTTR